ncbi:ENV2 protein, partial [Tichodroma muraria]|nr:ENV2 protein [Tichodroma muraria]
VSFCSQGYITGCLRNLYFRTKEVKDEPTNILAVPQSPTPVKFKLPWYRCAILLLWPLIGAQAGSDHHSHEPYWCVLCNPANGRAIQEVIVAGTPRFFVLIHDIFPGVVTHNTHPHFELYQSYWCLASNPGRDYCHQLGYWFCGYWGCETIVLSNQWAPSRTDEFLQVTWGPAGCMRPSFDSIGRVVYGFYDDRSKVCHQMIIEVLQTNMGWATGRMSSVFLHKPGKDPGEVVEIIRLPIVVPEAVGPNIVLRPGNPRANSTYLMTSREVRPSESGTTAFDSLYQMLDATFLPLNQSNPNFTESCWLCYDIKLPSYEAVALNNLFLWSNSQAPRQCQSGLPSRRITISHVTG